MSTISIQRVTTTEDRTLPIFKDTEAVIQQISDRAFGLSLARGRRSGSPLQDWIAAEREICWPAAELAERDNEYLVDIALPGFAPENIDVTATPHELIVHARTATAKSKEAERIVWSDFRTNDVYRRIEFCTDIDVDNVSASLTNGMLSVRAAKVKATEGPAKMIPVA